MAANKEDYQKPRRMRVPTIEMASEGRGISVVDLHSRQKRRKVMITAAASKRDRGHRQRQEWGTLLPWRLV
jgi:hypothetical protein